KAAQRATKLIIVPQSVRTIVAGRRSFPSKRHAKCESVTIPLRNRAAVHRATAGRDISNLTTAITFADLKVVRGRREIISTTSWSDSRSCRVVPPTIVQQRYQA